MDNRQETQDFLDIYSDNLSKRQMTELFDSLYNTEIVAAPVSHQLLWQRAVYFIAFMHFIVILGNSLSFFWLILSAPWYVAFPCCSMVVFLGFNKQIECPLTTLENYARRKAGLTPIKAFISYYFAKPIKKKLSTQRSI